MTQPTTKRLVTEAALEHGIASKLGTGGELDTGLSAANAANLYALGVAQGKFEGRPLYITGHSFMASTGHNTLRLWERIQKRLGMSTDVVMDAIGGTRMGQHSISVLGGATAYVVNSGRTVMACCSLNFPAGASWTTQFATTHTHAWRSLIAACSAKAAIGANTANFAYSSAWSKLSTLTSTGGAVWATKTVGSTFDLTYTESGQGCDIFLRTSTTGGGLVTFTEGATTLGTLDLTAATLDATSAIFRVRGLSNGAHTIRGTLTSGSLLIVDGYRIPSEYAPPVIVFLEGGVTDAFDAANPNENANLDIARPITASVAGEFSNAVVVDSRPEWDRATMTHDGIHPNDSGATVFATKGIAAMAALPWSKGGQIMDVNWPPTYTPPTGPTPPGGGFAGTAAGAAARVNYITNPSFENLTFNNYFPSGSGDSATGADNANGNIGANAARMVNGTSGSHYFSYGSTNTQAIPVTPGESLSASAYAKRLTSGTGTSSAHIEVTFWTSGGANVAGTATGSTVALTNAYQRLTVTGTVPATAAWANVVVHNDENSVSWCTDNWLYEKTGTVGTYFDGDSANGYWSGTVQASTSAILP